MNGLLAFSALDADGLTFAFTSAGIRVSALTTDWEALTVAETTVAIDLLETLQIDLQFPAEVTFDNVVVRLNVGDDGTQLFVGQFTGAGIRIDINLLQDLFSKAWADAIDVRKRSFDALFVWNIDTENTGHGVLD
jgi:hypothetical protein